MIFYAFPSIRASNIIVNMGFISIHAHRIFWMDTQGMVGYADYRQGRVFVCRVYIADRVC